MKIDIKDIKRGMLSKEYRYVQLLFTNIKLRVNDASKPHYYRFREEFEKEWSGIKEFREYILCEVGERPSKEYTIDRIDNNKGYIRGNLRWATRTEQNRNKNTNRTIKAFGKSLLMCEWCDLLGIDKRTLQARLDYLGYTPEQALLAPIRLKGFTSGQLSFALKNDIDINNFTLL